MGRKVKYARPQLPKRYKCYICNKEIIFLSDGNGGNIKCDASPCILNRNPLGASYYDANGRQFNAVEAPLGEWTVSVGYKLHHCKV